MHDDNEIQYVELEPYPRRRTEQKIQVATRRVWYDLSSRGLRQLDRAAAVRLADLLSFGEKRQVDAVYVSMCEEAELTEVKLRRSITRLVANKARLAKGWPCPDNLTHVSPYWARAVIIGFAVNRNQPKKPVTLYFDIETGRLAGKVAKHAVSESRSKSIFAVATEFPRGVPWLSLKQLIGLQVASRIELSDSRVEVDNVGVAKSQLTFNKRLTRSRFRNISKCPHNVPVDCVLCSVGRNECERSMLPGHTSMLRNVHGNAG